MGSLRLSPAKKSATSPFPTSSSVPALIVANSLTKVATGRVAPHASSNAGDPSASALVKNGLRQTVEPACLEGGQRM